MLVLSLCLLAGLYGEETRRRGQDRLVLLDGTAITGTVTSIRADGKIALAGSDHENPAENPLELNALRRIQRAADAAEAGPDGGEAQRLVVDLLDGGRLFADGLNISGEQCRVQWRYGALSLPLDMVRAVRLQPQQRDPDFEKALEGRAEFDLFFARSDQKLVMIKGFVEELDDENVVFQWNEQRQTIPRQKLFGIVVAVVDAAPDHTGQCHVTLKDGSHLWGKIASLQSGTEGQSANLVLHFNHDADVTIPWDCVVRVVVQSERLVYLSDLTPEEVDEQPVVAFPRPWQRDKSVGRRHLRLGTRAYSKGIGVQSRSRLVFNTDGKYELMTATIGIDAETGGRGDCLFIVLGDGEELLRKRMKGTDPPSELRVDIQGVKQLALLVEPGDDLDLGDHADWCDACFIRPSP